MNVREYAHSDHGNSAIAGRSKKGHRLADRDRRSRSSRFKIVIAAIAGLARRSSSRSSLIGARGARRGLGVRGTCDLSRLIALWFGLGGGHRRPHQGLVVLHLVPDSASCCRCSGCSRRSCTATSATSAAPVPDAAGKVVKLHDAMCMRCGTELEFPEVAIEPESAAIRSLTRVPPRAGRSRTLMRAVDALMECLKAEGVEVVFGYPGRRQPPDLRRVRTTRASATSSSATRPAAATPPRATRRPPGKVGVAFGTSRPGRDQPRHADHRRDDGLGPDRVHHRPGAHRAARHRRLPGGRHDRHHDADRQALVHDPAPARDPARRSTRRSTSRARAGPARCWSTSRRTSRARTSTTSRSTDVHLPGYQPTTEGNPKQIRLAAKALANARRPVHLRRRRRDQRQRGRGADRARASRPLPGHLHADGPRRASRRRTSSGWACSACTARAPPTTRWTRPT